LQREIFKDTMMTSQWLSVSMMLIVLSLVHIAASSRHTKTDQCPQPTINFCDYVVCENSGNCVENKTSSQCFECQCLPGFTGQLCETSIVTPTGCDPPCENGGQCQQASATTYACACPPEFTGTQCQTSIISTHPCVATPGVCQNGGTCTMYGADYLCNCPTGWSGQNCQTQDTVTTCTPNPCGAHGTCFQAVLPSGPVIICNCEAQWTGTYCETNLAATSVTTPTITIPTITTATQTLTPMTTATQTLTPMTNATLTPGVGSCSSSPCLNGGQCYNTGNSFICLCRPDWTGLTCNSPTSATTPPSSTSPSINACLSNPCNNGGTCYRHGNSFVCLCTTFYTGPVCDVIKTPTPPPVTTPGSTIKCAQYPCQNGATCYDTSTSYFCYCGMNSQFTGTNCDTPKVQSAPGCQLNCGTGYCIATGNQNYACMCGGILNPTTCPQQ
jgi:hypothetical protein